MVFDRSFVRKLRGEVEKALEPLSKTHGIVFKIGSITFSPDLFRTRLEARPVETQTPEAVQEKLASNFNRLCTSFGLKSTDRGREFVHAGRKYTIYDLNARSRGSQPDDNQVCCQSFSRLQP